MLGINMKMCSDCSKSEAWRRGRCKPCDYIVSKLYEKTPKGYLMRSYRNMLNRVNGLVKKSENIYKGLPICDKEEFYSWSLDPESGFTDLLENYKNQDYERCLAPSVDRIDKNKGYTLDNIRWMTISKNSSLSDKTEDDIEKIPVGIQLTERNKPYRVEKVFRGKKYYKTFYTLEEAKDYLEDIISGKMEENLK